MLDSTSLEDQYESPPNEFVSSTEHTTTMGVADHLGVVPTRALQHHACGGCAYSNNSSSAV